MFTHNLDPVLVDFGFIAIRWYSLAYIFGIIIGWWYGKKIILKKNEAFSSGINIKDFDDLITYLIFAIIFGGRFGYILFYNFEYFILNPIEILKIWKGGMSFHGALIGIILTTIIFSAKRKIKTFIFLDIIACVSPIGILLGRIANFINGELVGKITNVYWGVVFPKIDNLVRHPSQLYEAILEGILLFIIINFIYFKKNYKIGNCSSFFLIFYGIFRIFAEFFREPDIQVGYLFGPISMGMLLSALMIFAGTIIYFKKNNA
tara:strand:+ start:77 stop:862 length:786 start_codon:yes stop_codon:yes gene_type:complete